MDPKAAGAERLLRGLGVAVKTFALYPLPHPVATRSIEHLQAALRAYTEAHGPFAARVTKHAVTVDGASFRGGPHASLALYLFARKIAYIKILPTASDQALVAFVSALAMDRAGLEAAGGVRHLLRQAGVGNIQVAELQAQEPDDEPESLDLSGIFELLGRERLAPAERERLLEVVRTGADSARTLLESAYGGLEDGALDPLQVEHVYEALRTLDRMVLDEPFEDRSRLYANLAAAQLALREPMRSSVVQTLVRRDAAAAARLLGNHLGEEQLADLVAGAVGEGDVARQVTLFLRALCADRQKARAALVLLDARLRPPGAQANWLLEAVWPDLVLQPPQRRLPAEFVFNGAPAAAPGVEQDLRLKDTRTIDEDAATRDVIRTLVDVLRALGGHEHRKDVNDVADALTAYLGWLADREDYALLAEVLERVRSIARSEGGMPGAAAAGVLQKAAGGHLTAALLAALWAHRKTALERPLRACLAALSDHLVAPLVQTLATEGQSGVRAMLCDLLIEMYGDRVDDLGAFVTDQRWYLVRNIANVLGRLRHPQAVAYLSRLVAHADYRVRREALNALAAIGTSEAQAVLAAFLDDPDDRLKLRAMQSLDPWEGWRALPRLIAILERRDRFHRQFVLKQAALETLARVGARQSLPVVRRLAGARFAFSRRARELRRLAAETALAIEGRGPVPRVQPPMPDDDERSGP